MLRKAAFAGALAAALVSGGAAAQGFNDPDWPCVQRKIAHLSIGQMWAGPALPEASAAWTGDPELSRLVATIAARRTPMGEVERIVADLTGDGTRGRDERLLALFAGAFDAIDRERARIVDGITRYARKQRALSEHIDALDAEIAAAKAAAAPEDHDAQDRIEEMEDRLRWDARIYDDRRRSLTYVCESPRELEQRAFALARLVQSELSGG